MKTAKIILVLSVFSLLLPACKPSTPKPSVILIVLDTVRKDHLSLYGYPRKTTPFLEKLAKESVVFDNAYTPISLTAPAHTSLFTSSYPSEHQVLENGWKLQNWKQPLLAEVLKENGYQTGAILGSKILHRSINLNRGFDYYLDQGFVVPGSGADEDAKGPEPAEKKAADKSKPLNKRRARDVVNLAEDWLNQLDSHQPFFIFLHFWDAHRAYYLPDDFVRPFQLDPEFRAWLEANHYQLPEQYENVNEYDNALAYIDQNLESFFKFLDQKGILSRALVIIVADHGEGLGQHKVYWHCVKIYQEQVRIPMIIRFPDKAQAGRRLDPSASLIDIAPTILEYLHLKNTMESRGRSLLPVISGEEKAIRPCEYLERKWYPPDNPAHLEKWAPGRKAGIVCAAWKLIWADQEPIELFNLTNDPFELANLKEAEGKKSQELETDLKDHLQKIKFYSFKVQDYSQKMKKNLESLGYLK